jgi:hypothetical protein
MFFLVTGASGVGKSSVRKLIEADVADRVVCCELGMLGITPEWTVRWRQQAVEKVVQLALKQQEAGKHFLFCGDPVPPGELYAAPSAGKLAGIQVCFLDASPERQTERLSSRGESAELIPHHIAFAEWMRRHAVDHRHRPEVIIDQGWEKMRWEVWNSEEVTEVPWKSHVIDTSEMEPVEVARAVRCWMNAVPGINC